jgi:N-acetylglutamate synthase-like GNAT family acetyltransferase
MRRRRPDPAVVDILSRWLEEARAGTLRAVFVVGQHAEGHYFDEEFSAIDPDDLLFQVRTAVIRQSNALDAEPN